MQSAPEHRSGDAERLRVLRATGLLDAGPVPSLDRLTALAARLVGAGAAVVSLLDADRQRFASACGLSGDLDEERETPLSHSYCRYVVEDRAPLIVPDARLDARLCGNPAIADYDAVAYAGFPLRSPDGHVLGSFCVVDSRPRDWTAGELAILEDLAAAAESEVALRLAHGEQQRSAARMQAVLDSTNDAYVSIDADGAVIAWNSAAERLFGYGAAEALGRPVTELIIPERYHAMHAAGMARVRASGQSLLSGQRLQLTAVDRNGREFPAEMTLQVHFEHEQPVCHAFLHDITARMVALAELERQRQELEDEHTFLHALLDNLDTGVAACDSDGRLTFFNRALREVHGRDAAPGAPRETWAATYDLYAPDGRTLLEPDEIPLARANAGQSVRGEHLVVRGEHGPRRFVTNARPIDTADGRRLGSVVAMHDITEAHRAEEMRRARHAVAQVLSEATNAEQAAIRAVAVVADELGWLCGEYWQVTEDRAQIARLSSHTTGGRDLSAFTGDEPLSFVPGEGLPGLVWERGAEVWTSTVPGDVLTGSRARVAEQIGIRTGIGLPVRSGVRVLGVLAFFTGDDLPHDPDIAAMLDMIGAHLGRFVERRRAEDLNLALAAAREELLGQQQQQVERLRELDRLKDELSAVVIHELRNPVGVIRGYTEMLLESPHLDETDRRYAAVVERSTTHLQGLVDDLLDLARLDAGHLSIDPRPMPAGRLLRDVVENHRPSAYAKNLTVIEKLDPHLAVHGDARRLRQALDNLLSNAIKYTPDGGVVTVTAENHGGTVEIAVADTGIGIPAEQYPHLFSRFFRASNATTKGIKGTGLGLAVTKAIVDAHRGRLCASPAPGGGTVFTVTLPSSGC